MMIDKITEKMVIALYRSGMQIKEICNECGISQTGFYGIAKRNNLEPRVTKAPTEKDIIEICRLYSSGKSSRDLASLLPWGRVHILSIIKEKGLTRSYGEHSKLPVDHKCFNILTNESCYWAGYMAGDGCVSETTRGGNWCISLTSVDKEQVQRFKKFTKSDHKITKEDIGPPNRPKYKIQITSKNMGDTLISYGITQRKSLTMKISNQTLLNSRDFWRGVVDSDGNIHVHSGNKIPLVAIFTASIDFANQAKSYMESVGIDVSIYPPYGEGQSAYQVKTTARINAVNALCHLYSNCNESESLNRKRKQANEIIGKYNSICN